ncbi:tetratricopeptide repeat protein [Planctomycetaceae bacterium SH139]
MSKPNESQQPAIAQIGLLESIFDRVVDQPPEVRSVLLDDLCPNEEIRKQVGELLRVNSSTKFFVDNSLYPERVGFQVGQRIGPYKLLQEIGEGGMGVVYMAEQLEPVRRRVAVKVIKPGNETKQVLARFDAERQALSMMEHPNIAKVLDAGTTEAGRPYFVMELVKGKAITKYSAERGLSPRQTLELFIPVCQAVQHAHHKGIIHRDLKPSNVLVAEYDGRPVAKVIDFGVAKALNGPLTNMTMFTGFGQILGTLEYMSPEQSLLNQIDVDTRTDVYGLGVLLYELITGSTPFDKERLRSAAWEEMLRIIREEEPPIPSTRLSIGSHKESASRSPNPGKGHHDIQPHKLSKLVRGELDWIVMTALEKDRSRRYATPGDMANDIRNYLSGDAVSACPPSIAYRLRKLARRNKFAILTSGLVLAALVLGLVGTSWQAWRASQAEKDAIAERETADRQRVVAQALRQQAESEAARVKAMNDFLRTDLLGLAGGTTLVESASDLDPNLTLGTLLDRAKDRLDARFEGQPEHKLQIQMLLMYSFCSIGKYEEASSLLRATIDNLETSSGVNDPDLLDKIALLAQLFVQQGRWRDAKPLYREVLKGRKVVFGPSHAKTISAMNNLAIMNRLLGNHCEAAPLFEQCVELQAHKHGANSPAIAPLLSRLGASLGKLGNHQEAEQSLLRAINLQRQTVKNRFLDNSLNDLGQLCLSLGRYEEAKDLLSEAFDLREHLGEKSINFLDTKLALAIACRGLGRDEQASPILEETLNSLEGMPFFMSSILENLELLATVLREQGDETRAEEVLRLSLSISEVQHFEDWRKPKTLSVMAEISMARQQFAQAKEQLLEAYRILEHPGFKRGASDRYFARDEKLDRVFRRIMMQIIEMTEAVGDTVEAGNWKSKLDAIESHSFSDGTTTHMNISR